ncbi:MAG: hypothetical protein VB996_17290, partial [Pseudomonadales bacterium]
SSPPLELTADIVVNVSGYHFFAVTKTFYYLFLKYSINLLALFLRPLLLQFQLLPQLQRLLHLTLKVRHLPPQPLAK